MSKLRVEDLTENTKRRLQKVRNETINSFYDEILFQFVVDWENICNRLNKKREGFKNA